MKTRLPFGINELYLAHSRKIWGFFSYNHSKELDNIAVLLSARDLL